MPTKPHNGQRRTYEVQQLWQRHHVMKRLMAFGLSNRQVAAIMDCTPQTVSNIRNTPLMLAELAAINKQADASVIEAMQRDAPKSWQLLQDIRDGRIEEAGIKLRAQVAMNHLASVGLGRVTKVQGQLVHGHITPADIEAIKERSRQAGIIATAGGGGDNMNGMNGSEQNVVEAIAVEVLT